jgi:hypothetical protein
MTQGALSSLPPSFSPRRGLAGEVHRAAYLMQGRIPQTRRALAVVRERVLGEWIARELFGLDDPTRMPEGE